MVKRQPATTAEQPSVSATMVREATSDGTIPVAQQLPTYVVSDDALEMGASLANATTWINTKGSGAVQDIFATEVGTNLCDAIVIKYTGIGHRLVRPGIAHDADRSDGLDAYVQLDTPTAGTFELHPAYQRHRFDCPGNIGVEETVFVPKGPNAYDPPLVCIQIKVTNHSVVPRSLRIYGFARLRGGTAPDIVATYDPARRALVARNKSNPDNVRLFGTSAPRARYATTFDVSQVYEPMHIFPLGDDCGPSGDVLGALEVEFFLEGRQQYEVSFLFAHSGQGEAVAQQAYDQAHDVEGLLRQSTETWSDLLSRCQVMTPDPIVNEGALWSKANMLRVMARYPQGPAFTNEPGVSSNVVGRDAAWFVYGCDHFLPNFCQTLLDTFARLQDANGKIPEYYSALTGKTEDYGLNINDDTPLFILAANHHWRSSGDRRWLEATYPAIAKAARYIVSQQDERGLVFCSARGENVWGIASWRNVIPNYTINGAVTEINAECAAALRATSHLAENLGRPESEVAEFRRAYERLQQSMNTHLLNPANGVYYLNVDADGNVHTDVTGDEVFPVMFRVADREVSFRIISRLNAPDFWTDGGIRTVSRLSPDYHPFADVGLRGGVWPGLTWWYAFAAARYHPEFMVRALRASFEHYGIAPRRNNTVPGQFSEWFDGESLVNRGMRLSPWEPPRFLWAAVEGACGVMMQPTGMHVNPVVPPDWRWVAIRRLPFQGREIAFFAAREQGDAFRLYATVPIASDHPREQYTEDVSDRLLVYNQYARALAFARPGEWLVAVGNPLDQTAVVPLNLSKLLAADATYDSDLYHSERRQWLPGESGTGRDLARLAMQIDAGGFRLLRVRRPS